MINNLEEKDIKKIKNVLTQLEANICELKKIISDDTIGNLCFDIDTKSAKEYVEGEFDGRFMITKDNKKYLVPENYASKSKLVAGDTLKLVITSNGTHVFKQISPVDRKKIKGIFFATEGQFYVKTKEGDFRLLKAPVTYFKVKEGDEVTIIIPALKKSKWAALDNKIINKKSI